MTWLGFSGGTYTRTLHTYYILQGDYKWFILCMFMYKCAGNPLRLIHLLLMLPHACLMIHTGDVFIFPHL